AVALVVDDGVLALGAQDRAARDVFVGAERRALAFAHGAERRQRQVHGPVVDRLVAGPRQAGLDVAVFIAGADAQVVDALAKAFAGDDVYRAGDRACAGLGRRRPQDLDAL